MASKWKTYLVEAQVVDGEHEYRQFGLVRAYDLNEAQEKADKKGETYFLFGDGLAGVKSVNVIAIQDKEARVLTSLGIAYNID